MPGCEPNIPEFCDGGNQLILMCSQGKKAFPQIKGVWHWDFPLLNVHQSNSLDGGALGVRLQVVPHSPAPSSGPCGTFCLLRFHGGDSVNIGSMKK